MLTDPSVSPTSDSDKCCTGFQVTQAHTGEKQYFQNPHLVATPVCGNLPLHLPSARLGPFLLQLLLVPGPE